MHLVENKSSWLQDREASHYFETVFKVVVLLQEHGIVDDDLRRGNSEVDDAVVHGFGWLKAKGDQNWIQTS